jgi:hypothetical protein
MEKRHPTATITKERLRFGSNRPRTSMPAQSKEPPDVVTIFIEYEE